MPAKQQKKASLAANTSLLRQAALVHDVQKQAWSLTVACMAACLCWWRKKHSRTKSSDELDDGVMDAENEVGGGTHMPSPDARQHN